MRGEIVQDDLNRSETPSADLTVVSRTDSGINMTNCYKQRKLFFERYKSIDLKVLIGFWMKAGYLGPVYSAERAYSKGHGILLELINQQGILKYSDEDNEMIELSTDSVLNRCRHQGFCAVEDLGLVDSVELGKIGEVELKDGMLKKKKTKTKKGSVNHPSKNKELKYVAYSNPRPDSLKPLLDNIKRPSALLLRGCELADFPFEKFSTLTVLEISGLSRMSFSLERAISQMILLQSLKLSDLPIRTLGIDFSRLTKLCRLVLSGGLQLEYFSLETISELARLQCLHLSDLLIEELPTYFFFRLVDLQWVILRGCSKLLSLPTIKPLNKLKMLDLSYCSTLKKIATAVLQISDLQMLDFSYTAMSSIPTLKVTPNLTHLFLKNAKVSVLSSLRQVGSLEVLDLSGAESVIELKQLAGNKNLTVLDLSRTDIRSIDFLSDLIHLRKLILRECISLSKLSAVEKLTRLEVFDLSGCESLSDLPDGLSNLKSLKELNLSFTNVNHLPSFANLTSLLKLSLRGLELHSLKSLASLSTLEELDLNGVQIILPEESTFDLVQYLVNLQILNLSQTPVAQLPDVSKLVNLKELLLANCQNLKLLPDLQTLTNLETVDLSLPVDYTVSESEAHTVQFGSAPSNLRKLVLANRPGVLELFLWASLARLEYLDIRGTGEIDLVRVHSSQMENLQEVVGWDTNTHRGLVQGRSSKADEFHVVSSFYQSGFDRFKTNFKSLISRIQTELKSASPETLAEANIKNQAFGRHFGTMLTDLQYLLENINLLESSHDPKSSEELLHELMDAATDPSAYDFHLDSANLNVLLRLVLKLKLLVPTKQVNDLEASETTKEKKLHFTRRKNMENDDTGNVQDSLEMADLESSYRSLNAIEKKCLLCFSVFSCSEGRHENAGVLKSNSLVIKKRMLIHWWVGEGFIHPQHEKNLDPTPNQNLNLDPIVSSNPNQEMGSRSEMAAARYDASQVSKQVSTIEMLDESKTTEEIGKEILKTLEENKFIETVMNKGLDSGSCRMQPFVHSFVTKQAKQESFSDSGQLTSHVTRSQRVCLLKSQDNYPSSCKLWENYASSSKRLENLNTIHALLNVNEPIIDIRAEWFSKMKDLLVLHLGSWGSQNGDHIEVVDQKFLEDLKSMKQLRLLSLQGFSAIMKLPDSVCKLANLRILNLRDCSYLEELPADIGSLKNLIHLDVTNCRFLSMLPKGVRLLSKIEVLKGLVITFQDGGKQHGKACILSDLLKLEKLKKLSLIVNIEHFPSSKDLQVFREMKSLCNLKITWETSDIMFEASQDSAQEASRHSRWQQLKCWESKEGQNDIEKTLQSNHLDNLKKLVLCCFLSETAPDWLDPSELRNLEKLYIVGGDLKTLRGTEQNTWNVKNLRLKYLRNLKMLWPVLRDIFPNMTYLENHQCDKLTRFPCDDDGVWTIEREKHELA